jgi:hypothetical protein
MRPDRRLWLRVSAILQEKGRFFHAGFLIPRSGEIRAEDSQKSRRSLI